MSGAIAVAGKVLQGILGGAAFADNLYHVFVPYPSGGHVCDAQNQPIHNGHSILTDVDGQQVWLHQDQHAFDGKGNVIISAAHAMDMGLPVEGLQRPAPPAVVKPIDQGSEEQDQQLGTGYSYGQTDDTGRPVDPSDPQKGTLAAAGARPAASEADATSDRSGNDTGPGIAKANDPLRSAFTQGGPA